MKENAIIMHIIKKRVSGFTIIELLVVIAVIGILATLAVVSYNGWRHSLASSQVKSDLTNAGAAMKSAATFSDTGYPSSIPSSFSVSGGVTLVLFEQTDETFCIDGTSDSDNTVEFYIDQDTVEAGAQEGTCADRSTDTPPAVPTGLATTDIDETSIGLSWVAPAGIVSGYNLQCASDSGFIQIVDSWTSASSPSSITGLTVGTTVFCRVQAYNVAGTSNWSSQISATTATPPPPPPDPTIVDIGGGAFHSCAFIDVDNQPYCWGRNNYGQIGDNTVTTRTSPVTVLTSGALSGKTITAVSAGYYHTCAIADGQAYCWGRNTYGALGDGTTSTKAAPVAVSTSGVLSGKTVTEIAAGYYHTCAIADGQAYCWGYNGTGGLGDGTTTQSTVPVAVSTSGVLSGKTVTEISVSNQITCALADGQAYCWGRNTYGALGDGSTTNSSVPVAVSTSGVLSGKTVTAISAGELGTCAVANSAAYCWGYNAYGQIGNGTSGNNYTSPVAVSTSGVLSGKTVTGIAIRLYHTCAVASGGAYCWGWNNYGQLGDGTTTDRTSPVAVSTSGVLSGKTVTEITTTWYDGCVIADEAGYCWGLNDYGQLGDGTTTDSSVSTTLQSPWFP